MGIDFLYASGTIEVIKNNIVAIIILIYRQVVPIDGLAY